MTEIVILAFAAFFIALIGTKLTIFSLRNRAVSPDIDVLMGKRKAPPLDEAGIAITFALIIGLLGAEVSYAIVSPMFFLAGIALLKKLVKIPKFIKYCVWIFSVAIGLTAFPDPIFSGNISPVMDKIMAGGFWLLLIYSFSKLEKTESLLPTHIIAFGLGLAIIHILAEKDFSPFFTDSLVFACAGFGFLMWNLRPAKIFAGEIGAVPAGFIAGYLLILAATSGYFAGAMILPAYIFAYRGVKTAHHATFDMEWICRLIAGINMLLVYLAAGATIYPEMAGFNIVIAYAMSFGLEFFLSKNQRKSL